MVLRNYTRMETGKTIAAAKFSVAAGPLGLNAKGVKSISLS